MTPIETLKMDIESQGVALSSRAWASLCRSFAETRTSAGDCIYTQNHIGDHWLFLTEGVAGSRQNNVDGSLSIARFFEAGDFCANLTSTWKKDYSSDDLVALTDVAGVEIPDQVFRNEFLNGDEFGLFLRLKLMATLCFDKEVICIKTNASTEARYAFLEQQHRNVVDRVQQKDVAAFLGITPQGLSRFLRKRSRNG